MSYTVPGTEEISIPLVTAMLELGMVTDEDFRAPSSRLVDVFADPSEHTLLERALTRWWKAKTSHFRLFQWNLHVQTFDRSAGTDPWFVVSQHGDIPHLTLAPRMGILEAELEGFGQTVMAVLEDAFRYLPEAFIPSRVYGLASFHYWGGEADEEEWIKSEIAFGGEFNTREEVLANVDVFKRADFFQHMPEWAAFPQRTRSRTELERAARSTLGKNVIAACDAIWSLVTSSTFKLDPMSVGVHTLQLDSVEGAVILRWTDDDAITRVLDDGLQYFWECGECIEAISAQQVAARPKDLQQYFRDMEAMLQMATLVERLLLLIGETSQGAPQ